MKKQDQRTQQLHQILQLNARLTSCDNEKTLLDEAVSGICQILDLVDVTIFAWQVPQWNIRTTTSAVLQPGLDFPAGLTNPLNELVDSDTSDQLVHSLTDTPDINGRITSPLIVAEHLLGAVISHTTKKHDLEEAALLIQAFSVNLAILWQKLTEHLQIQERARQLESLQSGEVDTIWQANSALLEARYENQVLEFSQGSREETSNANGSSKLSSNRIPMIIGDRPIGDLTFPDDITLDEDEANFVEALVREMGNALNNAQLLQTTRSYSAQLQVAADVSQAANTILERDVLIRRVVDLVQESFNLYYVGLFIIDENDDAVLMAGTGQAGQIQVEQGHKLHIGGQSMIGKAISRDEAIVEQDVTQATDWLPNPYLPDTRSELAMPLRTRGRTIGALTVQSSQAGNFTEQNITVLQTVADQMATAIENASLFAQIQENLAETNRLYRAGRTISEADNALTVYQTLVDFAAESNLFDLANVITADPTSPEHLVSPVLWSRFEINYNPLDRFPNDKFAFSKRLTGRDVVIIKDVMDKKLVDENTRQLLLRNNIHSAAIIPIHSENRWLATLALDRTVPNPPTKQELQPFLTLCDQAAIILDNQQLLDETEALYRVSRALNQAQTKEEIYEITLREIAQYTSLRQCHVVIYDGRAGYGEIVAQYKQNEDGDLLKSWLPMDKDPIYHRLSKEREPILIQTDGPNTDQLAADIYLEPLGLHSSMLVPAFSHNELLGFIALDSYVDAEYFHKTNINFAQTVVDQFTTALESIRRFEEALARAGELISLNQIGAQVSGTLDQEKLAQVVYEQVGTLLDNSVFTLALFDDAIDLYRPLLFVDNGQNITPEARTLSPSEHLHTLLSKGEPVIADQKHPLAKTESELLGRPKNKRPKSYLWIPLIQDNTPTGLISVQSYKPLAYGENELQILRSIATQTMLAISNAQLFAETQERVAEWRLLFNITQAAASSIDSQERIENVVEALYANLGGADVTLFIANDAQQQLEAIATKGSLHHKNHLSYNEGLTGQVVQLGQPMLINDLRELPEFKTGHEGSLSQLVVPLNLGGRTIGLIDVQSQQVDAFSERDLRLLQSLSVSLAATIQTGRLIEDIQEANSRLRELDQLKTQFLANMSHELRTPLNSIIGFSRVILKGIDGPITPEQEEDLSSIHNSGQHLLNLINDILDVARIDAGKMTLAYEAINIEEIANSVNSTIRGLVKDKDIELVWKIDPGLPEIEADAIRIRQILLNFLSNAAKFTEKGQIILKIFQENRRQLHINIQDTGIGIAEEDFGVLFEAFEQVDSSATRMFGGTGLGLPITKKLVEMHQGEVWVESEVGVGSIFHILLPISQNLDENEEPELAAPVVDKPVDFRNGGQLTAEKRPTILVVDDEPGVVDLYERYLRSSPYQILRATSGIEALQAIREYDGFIRLVLLDINMPGLNGWDVLKEMRENPEIKDIPVIVCSIENDPVKAIKLGAKHSLLKPFIEDDLIHALQEVGLND